MSKVRTLDEFVERENAAENRELQFTGNWFIDAGILGFVNLMEEVYGWDLEELQKRIREEPEIVYYGYFPFAYFYKLSGSENEKLKKDVIDFIELNKNLGKKILEKIWWEFITELFRETWVQKKIQLMHESECYDKKGKVKPHYTDEKYRKLLKEREDLINKLIKNFKEKTQQILEKRKKSIEKDGRHNLSIEDIQFLEKNLNDFPDDEDFCKNVKEIIRVHKELENYLNQVWSGVKSKNISEENSVFCRLPIDSSFFKNYLFFNNSSGISKQLEDLKNLIDGNVSYSEYLSKIDGTISKFLPSDQEFPNIAYTEFRIKMIIEEIPYLFVYLINFLNAFIYVKNVGYILFYSNNLKFTYNVNKKIKIYLDKNGNTTDLRLLRITWQAVMDVVIESETIWSIENMYLIRYKRLSRQDLIGVEYIGIPKLQANIIIDDTLRNALNKNIPVNESKGKIENVWILEEFIKNKPLLSYLIHHIHLILADRISKKYYVAGVKSLIYASIVDAKIREFGKSNRLFEEDFFERYRGILTEIKEDAHWAFGISRIFKDLFEDFDERKSYANILLSMIKRSDKYRIVNTLLKTLIDKKADIKNVKSLVNFVFNKILPNDRSWKNYALVFVIGLIGGGDADGDE